MLKFQINIEKVNNLITILHPINDLKKITFIPQQLNKTKEKVIFITKEFEKIKDELYKDLKIQKNSLDEKYVKEKRRNQPKKA